MAEVKQAAKQEKMATRQAYGKALVEIGAENKNLVVMDADLSKSTMTAEFAKAYPERFFNMGIAEQNLYAAACGLALSGKVVCASTFAMFAAGRAFEIIRNSIGKHHHTIYVTCFVLMPNYITISPKRSRYVPKRIIFIRSNNFVLFS